MKKLLIFLLIITIILFLISIIKIINACVLIGKFDFCDLHVQLWSAFSLICIFLIIIIATKLKR